MQSLKLIYNPVLFLCNFSSSSLLRLLARLLAIRCVPVFDPVYVTYLTLKLLY